MKQFIVKKGFGNNGQIQNDPLQIPCFCSLRGDRFSNPLGTPTPDDLWVCQHPWSVAGKFKNFYVEILHIVENPTPNGWPAIDFTIYINDVPTALTVTVPAIPDQPAPPPGYMTYATNITDVATIQPGDRVCIARGPGHINPGINQFTAHIAWSLTFESDNPGESGYGCDSSQVGPIHAINLFTCSPLTGPLGFGLGGGNQPGVVSVVPLNGAVTRLDIHLDVGPGIGLIRTYAMQLNGVIQDGTGGTVDTTIVIGGDGYRPTGFREFTLPIHVLDYLAIAQLVNSTGTLCRVEASIRVKADIDGQSALGFYNAGASPDPSNQFGQDIATTGIGGWTATTAVAPVPNTFPDRWPLSEASFNAPGPLDTYSFENLCVHLDPGPAASDPTGGAEWFFVLRRAEADTACDVTVTNAITGPNTTIGTVNTGPFSSPTDRIALREVATNTPHGSQDAWTFLVIARSVIDTLAVSCASGRVTITGSGFSLSATVILTGPSGDLAFTVVSQTSTEIVLQIATPVMNGTYCATVDDSNTVCIDVVCFGPGCPANVGLLPVAGPNGCADQL